MEKNILVLVFIAIMLIGIFLYTDIFNSLYNNRIHPLITELDNIAKIVPIDINKRDDTDAKFIPKHKQI